MIQGGPTRAHTHNLRRPGVLLIEMVAALAILGVFILVCMQLYTTTMRLHREAMNAGVRTRMLAPPLEALRDDVWSALDFTATDSANVAIQQWEGRTIAWAVIASEDISGGGGQLERSVHKDGRVIAQLRWPLPRGVQARFEADGRLLGVMLSDEEFHRSQPLWFASQLHTIEEARR